MKNIKLKSLLNENLNYNLINYVIEIAEPFSSTNEIWDMRDVMYQDVEDLVDTIKGTGFISNNKWNKFLEALKKHRNAAPQEAKLIDNYFNVRK